MEPETLRDLLLDQGIRLKRYSAGQQPHTLCPKCEGGNHHEMSLAVKIDDDGLGATWICHRGKCGWQDGARLLASKPLPRQMRDKPPQRPADHTVTQANKPEWIYRFFADRRIGTRTVDAFGCYAIQRRFQEPIGLCEALVFPYRWNGEVVNRKYRASSSKKGQTQELNAEHTLFNVDALGDNPQEIVWVEGEPDVMAMFECGLTNAVSLKDGAPSASRDDKSDERTDKRYEALRTHGDLLDKAKKIILAGDNDGPGLALREELARRLGRHRCLIVEWPEGCKDACDVLLEHGPYAVLNAIKTAEPYPIDGLQRIRIGTLAALKAMPPPGIMSSGTRATDRILKLPKEGRLIIVTGIPSHGKTTWVRFVMVETAADNDRRWAVFSPEHQPWEHFVAECAEAHIGKPFYAIPNIETMTDEDIRMAEEWLSYRVTMLVCDAEDEAPTLDWILDRARYAVLRDGITDLLVDPWNEIDQQRGNLSETDYIGRSLQRLKAFGLRHGCNIWIVVHPAKPAALKPGETRTAPGPYDLHGSAHWANKTDLGITIHSPEQGKTEVHIWKSRFRRWGKRGDVAHLDFEQLTGRYRTPITEPSHQETPVHQRWQD